MLVFHHLRKMPFCLYELFNRPLQTKLKCILSLWPATCSIISLGLLLMNYIWIFFKQYSQKKTRIDSGLLVRGFYVRWYLITRAFQTRPVMLRVFLIFFLPVSKKKGLRLRQFSKWKQCVCYVIRFVCFYYYLMILVLLARCIVKVFILMI